ncbi:sugar ABC transporter substrate-binding protein [Actinoplanes regularis]|uniref:Monosaccharide ABC transporter substrate-binding protein, CUT2 family n=1 Tax=Actinoplanes regularis TaxID=52697 RepID=A0A239A2E0_9ACTN|nr:substrate-binding domain-containing protein [Actinoplanes regularis]GIE87143.1 sugar ABC transporter substrate-binding protein [Actinoplanes regularis]SNR89720.1 monosaccharide ABC transporter substrate-binding protein, CUT2 family [Actinoplanes regularis]
MRKALIALAAAGLMTSVTLTACDSGSDDGDTGGDKGSEITSTATSSGKGRNGVGVILPDSESSARWATDDPKALNAAFAKANVPHEIQNAEGNTEAFKGIAKAMLDSGVKVLMIVNLDSESGKAVIDLARSRKVPVIDYDRLTLNGNADYYVSFNNETVGKQQAEGLVKCLQDKGIEKPVIAELNGSPTDNNATLFKRGYDSILQPKYDNGDYVKGPDQSVPQWDNTEGGKIFTQMVEQWPDIDGVLAANDGLGNAAIEVLRDRKRNGAKAKGVPVTGQDATVQGLQNILLGDQCVTVFKSATEEADQAAKLAISLVTGKKPAADGKIVKDPETGRYVPSVLLTPKSVTAKNMMATVVESGAVRYEDLCTDKYKAACDKYKITPKK